MGMSIHNSKLVEFGYKWVLTQKGVDNLPSYKGEQKVGTVYAPYGYKSTHYDQVIYNKWLDNGYFIKVKG